MLGSQEPRIGLVPRQVGTAGDEAIETYALTGRVLDPWQELVLRDAMGERADGRWAAFEVGLVVPRQNGKDEILIARELWGLFVGGERTIVHSAHKFDTAMEHLERLAELIDGTAEFHGRLKKVVRTNGREAILLKTGQRVRFRARTRSGGGRGYTGECVIWNEAMDLPEQMVGAVMPIMSARSMLIPGPQTWYAGSAVNQETMADGLVLSRIREAGIKGENKRLAYFEWSADDDADPASPEAWAQANPSLGRRISPEYVEMEFQSPAMSAKEFRVERLGQGDWFDTDEDAGRPIPLALWADLAEHDQRNRITRFETFSVDTNTNQAWGSIGVAGQRADGLWQGAIVRRSHGKDWIIRRLRDGTFDGAALRLHEARPEARWCVDRGGPAANLIEDLKDAGLDVVELDSRDYADACADFLATVVQEKRFRYPSPQPELSEAVADVRTQPLGERWKWSRKNSTSADISPIVAVTNALWGAMNAEPEYASVISPQRAVSEEDELEALGPQAPRVLRPEDYTDCFRCRTGSHCPQHDPREGG